MKNRSILLISSILFLLTSCMSTTYYYSTLESEDRYMTKSENGNFVIENDSILVTYNFYGKNAPITISVFNKTNCPLFIDWKKSAVIIDGTAVSYKGDRMNIEGNTYGDSHTYNITDNYSTTASRGSLYGSITIPHDAEFVPPQSKIVHTPLELSNLSFKQIPDKEFTKEVFIKSSGFDENVKAMNFTFDDSPLSFRSYLTMYFDKDPVRPLILDNEFYISRIMKSGGLSPKDLAAKHGKPGNTFYLVETRDNVAGTIAAVTVVAVSGVVLNAVAKERSE